MVAAAVAVLAVVVLSIIAVISSNAHNRSSSTTTSTVGTTPTSTVASAPTTSPSAEVNPIRLATVGDCIERVTGADNHDGTSQVTVSIVACGSQRATDRVTRVMGNTDDCGESHWVRHTQPSTVVLCLQPVE